MTYIPFTKGERYDSDQLRPFDLAQAEAGHPVAMIAGHLGGLEVSHMFANSEEATMYHVVFWNTSFWQLSFIPKASVGKYLRLVATPTKGKS